MSTRRRVSSGRPPTRSRRRTRGFKLPRIVLPAISPDISRSIIGIVLLVLGAVTLIALILPGQGRLTDWWRDFFAPYFGAGRFLLPFLLLGAGYYLEWGRGKQPGSGWGATLLGSSITYVGLLGAIQVSGLREGGRIGRFLEDLLVPAITGPGAFVVLAAISAVGLAIAFELRLQDLVRPGATLARWFGTTAAASMRREQQAQGRLGATSTAGRIDGANGESPSTDQGVGRRGRRPALPPAGDAPGQTGIWSRGGDDGAGIPVAVPSQAPTSATFAPARGLAGAGGAASAVVEAPTFLRDLDDITDASDSPPTKERIAYVVPPISLLDDIPVPTSPGGEESVHRRNEEIIVRKLAGFSIQSQIVGRNAGPVVTQYEVQPAADVKVSRIEALSDDLAMALAARSLRIEAPIPGKSAVGIEVPNQEFNVVSLRGIMESVDIGAGGSKLTFALGRDVAGRAQAVDLAKMPHLLIAGATGSGKSVMVNALITSLLCEATPDEVRMILVDLKRVELAGYNGLPHLLVPVITEPERAKAALKWAVNEMEGRYRRFAGATARNIRGYNESRADPEDRMPYIVIVIDFLEARLLLLQDGPQLILKLLARELVTEWHRQGQQDAGDGGVDPGLQHEVPEKGADHGIGQRSRGSVAAIAEGQPPDRKRKKQRAHIEAVRVEDSDHQHRAEIVHDRQGQQEDLERQADSIAEQRQDAEGERDVGRHRDTPTPDARCPGVECDEDERGHDHATERRGDRKGGSPPALQLADDEFALDLETDEEEEDRHEQVVDPEQQRLLERPLAEPEARPELEHLEVARRPRRVGPGERRDRGDDQNDAAGALGPDELLDRAHDVADRRSDAGSLHHEMVRGCPGFGR